MKTLNDKEFTKFNYLIGFVNNIIEMVSDPETDQSANCKGSSVYSIGYETGDKDNLKLGCLEEDEGSVSEFKANLQSVESMIKDVLTINFSKQWEELQK